MPFYEYQCSACGAQVEILQKITDAPLKKCPECGRSKLAKLVSAPVFRLKGGGWYETDFKSDKDTKRNLVDSGERGESTTEKAGEKPAEKPSDKDKPAAKADSAPAPKAQSAAETGGKSTRRAARPVARAAASKPARKKSGTGRAKR
jgi:putative FmdB family regulatory protein